MAKKRVTPQNCNRERDLVLRLLPQRATAASAALKYSDGFERIALLKLLPGGDLGFGIGGPTVRGSRRLIHAVVFLMLASGCEQPAKQSQCDDK